MANNRNSDLREIKTQAVYVSGTAIIAECELAKAARAGKAIGIGLCSLNPSGCFDFANEICSQVFDMPVIYVQKDSFSGKQYQLLSNPKGNTTYEVAFITGCHLKLVDLVPIAYQPTAQVILGLKKQYELLANKAL